MPEPQHGIRCDDELWTRFRVAALSQRMTLSTFLTELLDTHDRTAALEAELATYRAAS